MYPILDLLNILDTANPRAVDLLSEMRNARGRGRSGTCEALACVYRADHQRFFNELRKQDLVELLTEPSDVDGVGYYLRAANGYSKDVLVQLAVRLFRDGDVREPIEEAEDEDLGEEGAEEEEHDAADGLSDDDFEFNPVASAMPPHDYQRTLIAALAKDVSSAAPGKRLLINVATGGGKTRIANDWIWEHALPNELRVLWITKDWVLLRQAATDLCRRRRGVAKRLGYVGDRGTHLLHSLGDRPGAQVVYTTIHTWRSRKDTAFATERFDAVIIDESHWGEGKRAYRDLRAKYKEQAVFIGLTATPRKRTGFALVGRRYDYRTLMQRGFLARALPTRIGTGIHWSPDTSSSHGDFDRASLAKLARSDKRNNLIVDTYVEGRHKFGKTLIFACDIEHAEAIVAKLRERSVAVEALHSGMRSEDRHKVIRRFTDGTIRVLVNVAMMTHGVDIPDIEAVLLARPTASTTLFAQMVGRAVRKTEAKSHFHLVDFVDSLQTHGNVLVSSRNYFGDIESVVPAAHGQSRKRSHHAYTKAPFEHIRKLDGYEEIAGFDLQPEQTFGIEFELTRDGFNGRRPRDWMKVATELLQAIPAPKATRAYAEYHDAAKDHAVWNVEYDRSCGWEVTSRVLSGSDGFLEVVDVCRKLQSVAETLGLKLTPQTGTHVHLGWTPNVEALRRLMQLVSHFEPALYSLVAPSRSGNPYCEPIRKHITKLAALPSLRGWEQHFENHERRHLSVNPSNLFDTLRTIEVRLHSGTIEGPKILGWLSLWMRLLDVARGTKPLPEGKALLRDLPLTVGPQGDVLVLAEYAMASRELSSYLRTRRNFVMDGQWLKHPEHGPKARDVFVSWA